LFPFCSDPLTKEKVSVPVLKYNRTAHWKRREATRVMDRPERKNREKRSLERKIAG
jgi:hypothetical protein